MNKFEYGIDSITLWNVSGMDLEYKYNGHDGLIPAYSKKSFYDPYMAQHILNKLENFGVTKIDYNELRRKEFPLEEDYLEDLEIKALEKLLNKFDSLVNNEKRFEYLCQANKDYTNTSSSKLEEFSAIYSTVKRQLEKLTGKQIRKAKKTVTYKQKPIKEKKVVNNSKKKKEEVNESTNNED